MSNDPTDEQSHILKLAQTTDANLMINALAGVGKTTTLEMIESVVSAKPILYMVFNKKNVEIARKRMASTTTVINFNSQGHRIWANYCSRRLTLNPKKIPDILRSIINEAKTHERSALWDAFWPVVSAVNHARAIGYVPPGHQFARKAIADVSDLQFALDEEADTFTLDLIDQVLTRSIAEAFAGAIDFNDQVYMPALFGGAFPKFPLVLVDEYQDLSPINHKMISKLVHGRLIGVGDPNQNIYGFRGAKAQGMADAVEQYLMTECDLSVSFRCPERVVRSVHWLVPHFKWVKPGGEVRELRELHIGSIADDATFICRNNAPLFSLAMRLLTAGRSVYIAGSDVGPKVLAQLRRLGREDLPQAHLLAAIEEFRATALERGSKTADDTADCMRVFASHGANLAQALAYAEHLFAQKGHLSFYTGHKAKGMEWSTVYHLDPFLLGSSQQEDNLRYVISTRSADRLYSIRSQDIRF